MEALAAACGGRAPPGEDPEPDGEVDADDGASDSDDSSNHDNDSVSSPALSALSSLTSPVALLPSPASLATLPSPSPHDNLELHNINVKPPTPNMLNPPQALPLQRLPVGTNPRDANNPLSVNRLTSRSCGFNGISDAHLAAIRSTSTNQLPPQMMPFGQRDYSAKNIPSSSNGGTPNILGEYSRNLSGFGNHHNHHLLGEPPRNGGNIPTSNGSGGGNASAGTSPSGSNTNNTNNTNNSNKVISVS